MGQLQHEIEIKLSKKERKALRNQQELEQSNSIEYELQEEIEKKPSKKIKLEQQIEEQPQQIEKKPYEITQEEADAFRQQHQLNLSGRDHTSAMFYPYLTFKTPMSKKIMKVTKQYTVPSPIQSQSWPIILAERDCIAIAETGSGKTLGFLLPALVHIKRQMKEQVDTKKPLVIVISPTRELATQIFEVCQKAVEGSSIRCACVYGGIPKNVQIQELKIGAQIVIGTPGRIADLYQDGYLQTDEVSMAILDEADRMLDAGFEPQIKIIFENLQKQRQTIMFSATWPVEVQKIATSYLKDPVMIKIGTDEGSANKRVTQIVEVIEDRARQPRLIEILKQNHDGKNKVIVFVLYKHEASRIEGFLEMKGFSCVSLHGDKSQMARNDAFEKFRSGQVPILVATDVAARGLDIPNVEFVINYSFPLTVSDYVHRIGRTGRAGKTGVSITFFQESQDKKLAGDLAEVMKEAGQPVPQKIIDFGPTISKKKQHTLYGDFYKEIDETKKATKIKLC